MNLYSYLLITAGIPQQLAVAVTGFSTDPLTNTLVLVGLLLLIGTMLETIAALTVFKLVLLTGVKVAGIDPVYFGIVRPSRGDQAPDDPFGIIPFVLKRITDISVERIV